MFIMIEQQPRKNFCHSITTKLPGEAILWVFHHHFDCRWISVTAVSWASPGEVNGKTTMIYPTKWLLPVFLPVAIGIIWDGNLLFIRFSCLLIHSVRSRCLSYLHYLEEHEDFLYSKVSLMKRDRSKLWMHPYVTFHQGDERYIS